MQPQRKPDPFSVDVQGSLGEEQRVLLESALAESFDEDGGAADATHPSSLYEPQESENVQQAVQQHHKQQYEKHLWSLEELATTVECAHRIKKVAPAECLKKMLTTYQELEKWLLRASKADSTDSKGIVRLMQQAESTITELATSELMLIEILTPGEYRILCSIFPQYLQTVREQYQNTVQSCFGWGQEEIAQKEPTHPANPGDSVSIWQRFLQIVRRIMNYLCCCCRCFFAHPERVVPEESSESLRCTLTALQKKWEEHAACLQHLQDTGQLTLSAAHALCVLFTEYVEKDVAGRKKGLPNDLESAILEIEERLCSCLKAISINVTAQNTAQYIELFQCLQDMGEFLPLFVGLEHTQTVLLWLIYALEEQISHNLRLMCIRQSGVLATTIDAVQAIMHLTELTLHTQSEQAYQQRCQEMIDRTFSQNQDSDLARQCKNLLENQDTLLEFFALYTDSYRSFGMVSNRQQQKMRCFQQTCLLMLEKQANGNQDARITSAMKKIKHPETIPSPMTPPTEDSLLTYLCFLGTVLSPEGPLYHSTAPVTPKVMEYFNQEWNKEEFSQPCPIRVLGGYTSFLQRQGMKHPEEKKDPCLQHVEIIEAQDLSPALQKILPQNAKIPLYNVFCRDACRSTYIVNQVRITGKSHSTQAVPEVTINLVEALLCALLEAGYPVEEAITHLYDISVTCHQGIAACMQTVLHGKPLIACEDGTLLSIGNLKQKKQPSPRNQIYDISITSGKHFVTCCYDSSLYIMMGYKPISEDEQHYQQWQCVYGMNEEGDFTVCKELPSAQYGLSFAVQIDGKIQVADCILAANILKPSENDSCHLLGQVNKDELCLEFLS